MKAPPLAQKGSTCSTGDAREAGQEDPLKEETATHSSILAGKIPRAAVHRAAKQLGTTEHSTQQSKELKYLKNIKYLRTQTDWTK